MAKDGAETTPEADVVGHDQAGGKGKPRPVRRSQRHHAAWLGGRLVLIVLGFVLVVAAAAFILKGRTIHLPVWAVAEVETRINAAIGDTHLPPGSVIGIGAVEMAVDRDFVPRFVLRDIRLVDATGQSFLALPEIRAALSPAALLSGQLRPSALRLTGARMTITRDSDGRIALQVGGLSGSSGLQSGADVLDALDRMFSTATLADLALIEADALALTLIDQRAGRRWEVGDGRLVIENKDDGIAAELALTLLDGATPAQARLSMETSKADSSAVIRATVDRVSSADLAAQAAPLALLAAVDAPISGAIEATLGADGGLALLNGELTLASGSLRTGQGGSVGFDRAGLSLGYDTSRQRVTLDRLVVESPSLRLQAVGTVDLVDASGALNPSGALPDALIGQFEISEMRVDPEGLFEEPVDFSSGNLDLRLTLQPFQLEIGQLSLVAGEDRLVLSGSIKDTPEGPEAALDVALNQIGTERMIKLWPVSVVPNTRKWLADNVGQGELKDVNAALRILPGKAPRFALDYEFADAEVRFVRTLPPIQAGHGRASIEGNVYTIVLDGGQVTAPEGGQIDVAGSVFRVLDISVFPAQAEVRLISRSDLTAALSLLDQDPFGFVRKAGREVSLGQGRAILVSDLRFPLVQKLGPGDVFFDVSGRVLDFTSDKLVPGATVASPDLAVRVTTNGITLSGEGSLGPVPVVARYEQAFGPEAGGSATVLGTALLTADRLAALGVALPDGWLSGETEARIDLRLPKGRPAEMTLESDLSGARLSLPSLSWTKGGRTTGDLALKAVLSSPPVITSISLSAPGLDAKGSITVRKGGGLDLADFPTLRVGSWLDAAVRITGRGTGRPVDVAITGGTLDLRSRPTGEGSGGDGGQIAVALDRLVISSGISLTGFAGDFALRQGGIDGRFRAAVNGAGRIDGAAVPVRGGTAVRITSSDAGRVMAAAGIFAKGRGGSLDLTLQPNGPSGQFQGIATFRDLSITGAPVLAEMLAAVSVVGLLEQMNGQGIVFSEGDVSFIMRPSGVDILSGAAVGASLGISFAGLYRAGSGELDIAGTISPLFLLNGLGQIFGRPGEGLFGFNYQLTGTADDPRVSVNPLSILTPGMFREIFRRPPPVLEGN